MSTSAQPAGVGYSLPRGCATPQGQGRQVIPLSLQAGDTDSLPQQPQLSWEAAREECPQEAGEQP